MKRYILFGIGFIIASSLIVFGLRLGDYWEVLRNAALLCLSCIGISN